MSSTLPLRLHWILLFPMALVAMVVCLGVAPAHAQTGGTNFVALGSDYFATQSGTEFDLIPLRGDPFGPGATDTIVERTANIPINGASAPLMLTNLQLVSTAPVTLGTYTGLIYISLDPLNLSNDTGTISVQGSLSGGTFNSFFDVFFDICTAPGVMGVGCGTGT